MVVRRWDSYFATRMDLRTVLLRQRRPRMCAPRLFERSVGWAFVRARPAGRSNATPTWAVREVSRT